jgi:DNA-binding NarL/FixJ family response regulator
MGGSSAEHDLTERSKELGCLRGIAGLFTVKRRPLEETLRTAAELIVHGWQYPETACVRISLLGIDVRTPGYEACTHRMDHPIDVAGRCGGSIEVAYPPEASRIGSSLFLLSEAELLEAIAVLMGSMVEIATARERLERQATQLRAGRAALRRKNIALREILAQLEAEKRLLSRRLRSTLRSVILPQVARMRRPSLSAAARERYVALLESHLDELASTFGGKGVAELSSRLSPREVEIADLVRAGSVSKEIADMLGLSEATVERHRHNIRRKLGITDASVNLASYLSEI